MAERIAMIRNGIFHRFDGFHEVIREATRDEKLIWNEVEKLSREIEKLSHACERCGHKRGLQPGESNDR